jgi:aminoglycoside phosphotransferase (APT) family kinase protein
VPPAPAASDLAAPLERFLARELRADAVHVAGLDRSTEGFSQETFRFESEIVRGGRSERRAWVAKREPEAGLLEPYDLEPEFRVLHALGGEPGILAPPTPFFCADPAVLERSFYLMERLPGRVPLPAAGPDGRPPFDDAERHALAPQVGAALAALHAVDWRSRGLGFLGDPGARAAERELARWKARIDKAALPLAPILADSLAWLEANLPESPETTLVHGDFRLGNFLVTGEGAGARLSGVLDWEMVHLGDPLEDLAWCASMLWRGGTPYAAALLPPGELAALYARHSERAVDAGRLRFYEMFSVVKMIAIMLTGIRAFLDGRTSDLRMAIFDHQLPFLFALLAVTRGWLPGAAS